MPWNGVFKVMEASMSRNNTVKILLIIVLTIFISSISFADTKITPRAVKPNVTEQKPKVVVPKAEDSITALPAAGAAVHPVGAGVQIKGGVGPVDGAILPQGNQTTAGVTSQVKPGDIIQGAENIWQPLVELPAAKKGIVGSCDQNKVPDGALIRTTVDVGGAAMPTCFEYENSMVSKVVDPRGYATTVRSDSLQRPLEIKDYKGSTISYVNGYDSNSRLIHSEVRNPDLYGDAVSEISKMLEYDVLGNLTSDRLEEGAETFIARNLDGQVIAIVDKSGFGGSISYNGAGQVLGLAYCQINGESQSCEPGTVLSSVQYAYDPQGRIASETTLDGAVTSYVYDNFSRVWQGTLPTGEYFVNQYDPKDRVVQTDWYNDRRERIKIIQLSYDDKGRVVNRLDWGYRVVHALQGINASSTGFLQVNYLYNDPQKEVRIIATDDGGMRAPITFNYDNLGRLTKLSGDGMNDTLYTYDNTGLRSVDEKGLVTSYENGVMGVEKITDAQGNTSQFRYKWDGQVGMAQNALGTIVKMDYDKFGFPLKVSLPGLNSDKVRLSFEYDSLRRLVAVKDGRLPAELLEGTEYYESGENKGLVRRSVKGDGLSSITYDVYRNGRPVHWIDSAGNQFNAVHDVLGRITALRAQGGDNKTYEVRFTYAPLGYLALVERTVDGVTEARTEFVRDSLGRMFEEIQTVNDSRYVVSTTYGASEGGVASIRTPSGSTARYQYSSGGRLRNVNATFIGAVNVPVSQLSASYSFDQMLPTQLNEIQYGNGTSTLYNWRMGQLLGLQAMKIREAEAQVNEQVAGAQGGERPLFNGQGPVWMNNMMQQQMNREQFGPQGQPQPVRALMDEIYGETYKYYKIRPFVIQKRFGLNLSPILRPVILGYWYDIVDNIIKQSELTRLVEEPKDLFEASSISDDWSKRWSYDETDAMKSEEGPTYRKDYHLTPSGKIRDFVELLGCSLVPQDPASKTEWQTNCPPAVRPNHIEYDGNGNIIRRAGTYAYDPFGNLINVTIGDKNISYIYDGLGRRVGVSINETDLRHYIYSGQNVVEMRELSRRPAVNEHARQNIGGQEILQGPVAGEVEARVERQQGAIPLVEKIVNYVYSGGIDDLIGMYDSKKGVFYSHRGADGSVAAWSDGSGNVVQYNVYQDPWGKYTAYKPDGSKIERKDEVSLISYAGLELDPDSELYYNRLRWYDPVIARFISPDPLGVSGGIGLYTRAKNNPNVYNDWSGGSPNKNVVGQGNGEPRPTLSVDDNNRFVETLNTFKWWITNIYPENLRRAKLHAEFVLDDPWEILSVLSNLFSFGGAIDDMGVDSLKLTMSARYASATVKTVNDLAMVLGGVRAGQVVSQAIARAEVKHIARKVLAQKGLTEDSFVYRWTRAKYFKDGFAIPNRRSMALIRDHYAPKVPNSMLPSLAEIQSNPYAAEFAKSLDVADVAEISPKISASKLSAPGLNVSDVPVNGYSRPGDILIRIRLSDVQGLRVYDDVGSMASGCLYITGEGAIPATLIKNLP